MCEVVDAAVPGAEIAEQLTAVLMEEIMATEQLVIKDMGQTGDAPAMETVAAAQIAVGAAPGTASSRSSQSKCPRRTPRGPSAP